MTITYQKYIVIHEGISVVFSFQSFFCIQMPYVSLLFLRWHGVCLCVSLLYLFCCFANWLRVNYNSIPLIIIFFLEQQLKTKRNEEEKIQHHRYPEKKFAYTRSNCVCVYYWCDGMAFSLCVCVSANSIIIIIDEILEKDNNI